jgi:hypothetical protein
MHTTTPVTDRTVTIKEIADLRAEADGAYLVKEEQQSWGLEADEQAAAFELAESLAEAAEQAYNAAARQPAPHRYPAVSEAALKSGLAALADRYAAVAQTAEQAYNAAASAKTTTAIANVCIDIATTGEEGMAHGLASFAIEDGVAGDLNTSFEPRYFTNPEALSEHIDSEVIRSFAEAGYFAENAGTEDAGDGTSMMREYEVRPIAPRPTAYTAAAVLVDDFA